MLKLTPPAPSRRPAADRRTRRISPRLEGLETRQVQSSLALMEYAPVVSTAPAPAPTNYAIDYRSFDPWPPMPPRNWNG